MTKLQFWKRNSLFLLGVLFFSTWYSCNNDSLIGSDLVDLDGIEVVFSDTTTINATIIPGTDSIQMNGENLVSNDIFLGEVNDPFFGFQKFDAFIQSGLGSSAPSFYDYDNAAFATIDSIILIINVDTSLYYGDQEAYHDIEVALLQDELDQDVDLYTFDDLPTEMMNVGENSSIRASMDNFDLSFQGDTSSTLPSLRIKLDNDFGQMIIDDTAAVKTDTLFKELVKGFKIKSIPTSSSIIPLDVTTQTLDNIGNKMLLFYTDTIPKVYSFPLGGVRHNYLERDIAGTVVESSYNNDAFSDSLLMIQGFGGANLKLEFPFASFENYENILVKKAEIEVTVAELPGEDETLQPISLFFLYDDIYSSEEQMLLSDLQIASSVGSITGAFGGNLQEETDDNGTVIRRFYNFNVTSYFQQLIDQGSISENSIYMEAAIEKVSPGRSIFYGPGNSTYPMKFKLTYSVPN